MKLAVIDLETSGLNATPQKGGRFSSYENEPHRPGVDPDCILEVGIAFLDGDTLKEEWCATMLVRPPGIESIHSFDVWLAALQERNRFVYDLHSKPGEKGEPSLFEEMRTALYEKTPATFEGAENNIVQVFKDSSSPKFRELGDKMHPGNSDIMFTGNSIANLDIPMLRLWMPEVHKLLSYRILDVSVLRTFYQDIAKVQLPEQLAADIKSGGGGHRALSDAVFCAKSLRELASFAREQMPAGARFGRGFAS